MTCPVVRLDDAIHVQRMPPTRERDSLEFALSFPAQQHARAPHATRGVVVCPPQPFLGGDLDNNVVREVSATIARSGHPALRFNYRGVGASRDVAPQVSRFEHWRRVEAARDHAAVHADSRTALERAARWFDVVALVGYSFGAYVAARLALALAPGLPLVLIAPPLRSIDLSALSEHRGSQLILVAGKDALDPAPDSDALRARFPVASIIRFDDADHFFRGDEARVASVVCDFLAPVLKAEVTATP